MGQEFVVPSFNTNRYYNKNTETIAVLPTGLTAGMVIYVQSDGTLDGSLNHFWDNTNNRLLIGTNTGIAIATGGNFQVVTPAITSTAEVLSTWSVSDDAVSNFKIVNNTSTGSTFAPSLQGTAASTTQFGVELVGIASTDTGTTSVVGFRAQTAAGAALTARPAFIWRNFSTEMMQLDALGRLRVNTAAAYSETGLTSQGVLYYGSTGGVLTLSAYSSSGNTQFNLRTAIGAGTNATRFSISSTGAIAMTPATTLSVTTVGGTTFTETAAASTGEVLSTWSVSDDAVSKIYFDNATTVDGNFLPRLNFVQSGTSASFITFQGTTDSGASALGIINSRIGAATNPGTRPLLQFQRNGTGVAIWDAFGRLTLAPVASTSGVVADFILTPSAKTGITASTESNVFRIDTATRTWATGALALNRDVLINGMTYAAAGATVITTAVTLDIGIPIAGSNVTITNIAALRVNGGTTAPIIGTGTLRLGSQAGGLGLDILTTGISPTSNNVLAVVSVINGMSVTKTASTGANGKSLVITGAADTALTASTESVAVNFNQAFTRQFNTGAIATQREFIIQAPTYGFVGASTITTAATFVVAGQPLAGTNATLTNSYAAWFQATAVASAAERISLWTVSDDATGKVEILNLSTSDAVFASAIQGSSDSTTQGFAVRGLITTDTGTNAALAFVAATTGLSAIATRPLFIWQNAGTTVMSMSAAGGLVINGGSAPSLVVGGATVNANAIADFQSTTKAFMPPRMTTAQKNAIASPTAGMVVYDTTLNKLCVYTTAWETVTSI